MKLSQQVGLFDEIPWGYVPVWENHATRMFICYPIGIHWIARLIRGFWLWTMKQSRRERYERDIYRNGWDSGRQVGRKEGRQQKTEELIEKLCFGIEDGLQKRIKAFLGDEE